jgi:prepilin peptidase CpaA
VLSCSAALLGASLNAWHFGLSGLAWSAAGAGLMLMLLLMPFALGGIGGGDVKMMMAIGAFLGPRVAVVSLSAGLALGGVVMVLHLLRLGRLREKLAALGSMVRSVLITQSFDGLRASRHDPGAIALPYSIPLGLGTLATVFVGRAFGFPMHL